MSHIVAATMSQSVIGPLAGMCVYQMVSCLSKFRMKNVLAIIGFGIAKTLETSIAAT